MEEQQNEFGQNKTLPTPKPPKEPMRPGVVALCVICGTIMFLGFWYILFSQFFGSLFGSINAMGASTYAAAPLGDTIDVFKIQGVIQEGSTTYNHQWTINQIDALMNNGSNKGIVLYINSPGGGVYESDELYLKLKEYKEETGRPVYAYMAQEAASGGLYISMAADKIFANRMAITGSIGVIMSTIDTTGLQKLIGVKQENITSGPNKAMGNPLTDEQREILSSLIDETYDIFVSIIADSRGLNEAKVREMADGRVYSPKQAKELGLIDDVISYEEAMQTFVKDNKLENCTIYEQVAPVSTWQQILSQVSSNIGTGKAIAIDNFGAIQSYIEHNSSPRLMYYMQ